MLTPCRTGRKARATPKIVASRPDGDYLTKPFSPSLVRMRVRNHIELQRLRAQVGGERP